MGLTDSVLKMLHECPREMLEEAFMSACQELSVCKQHMNMAWTNPKTGKEEWIRGNSLNNQMLLHLTNPDMAFED